MLNFFITKALTNLSVFQVLILVPNIGINKVSFICKSNGILENLKFKKLDERQIKFFVGWIETFFSNGEHFIGSEFFISKKKRLTFLKSIQHYKAVRFFKGLPVRGQRTHTNAKTVRIVFKKEC